MAELAAFRALRYDPEAVGDLAAVVSPPYDVIDDRARAGFEASSTYNVVRLILPRDENGRDTAARYGHARAILEAWCAAGVLREDDDASLTIYEQRYLVAGEQRTQRGILGAVTLEGLLPHERTYDDIVADRLELLRATETNLDPIFCVYDGQDPAAHEALAAAAETEPVARFTTADGIEHAFWRLTGSDAIATVTGSLEKASVVIADGHHRWRTAMRYRDERRAAEGPGPWDAQMMFLVDPSRWGPSLLPIHRVVRDREAEGVLDTLGAVFTIEPAPREDPEGLARELAARRAGGRCFAMLDAGRAWWLTVRDHAAERAAMPAERSEAWRDLDVAVLHHLVFERILGGATASFVHSATEAAAEVGGNGIAFLLAPMPFEAVRAVAETGEPMPQKSTYFIPKPATGIAMRSLRRSDR